MPPKKSKPTGQPIRSYTYLLLTYSQVGDDFDYNKLKRIVDNHQGKFVIAREKHKDGGTHYHAFLAFTAKRFQTRNHTLFDIPYHPDWLPVRTSPWKAYDYTTKDGDIVFTNLDRPASSHPQKTPHLLPYHTSTTLNPPQLDVSQACCRNLQQNTHSLKMESRNVPYDSVVLSLEDAQALFAVINRTSGTIRWPSVASDIGTTVEIV
jgi:hypothetical protein